MATIPEPDWLSLDETANLVRECTGAEGSRIEAALTRAFRNGNITTRGRCHYYFAHEMQMELKGYCWDRAEVDWQTSKFKQGVSIFIDVEICRKDILLWIGYEEDTPDAIDGVMESPKEREDDFKIDNSLIKPETLERWNKLGPDLQAKYYRWHLMAIGMKGRGASQRKIARNISLEYAENGRHPRGYGSDNIRKRLSDYFVDW